VFELLIFVNVAGCDVVGGGQAPMSCLASSIVPDRRESIADRINDQN